MGPLRTSRARAVTALVALVALTSMACRKRAPTPPAEEDPPPPPVDTSPISQPRAFDGVADASAQGSPRGTSAIDLPAIDSNVPDGCSGRHVPLCLGTLANACCTSGKPVTYASCTRATSMRWQCPAGKVLDTACPRDTKRCDPALVGALVEYAPVKIVSGGTLGDGFSFSLSASADFGGNKGTAKQALSYKGAVVTDRLDTAYGPPDGSAALYCESPAATFLFISKTKKKTKLSPDACPSEVLWNLDDGTVAVKLPKRTATVSYR